MSYNSKYSGQQVENMLDQVASGNAGGGGGGITVETDPIFSASAAAKITEENISSWNNKVDKVDGKQLSTEDFTTLLKQKLDGLSNYDDTEIQEAVSKLRTDLDTLVSGDTTTAIKTFNEVIAFLDGISDTEDLSSIIASIEQQISAKGTYTKPSTGIPKSDLASALQISLGKADTALQSVPSEYVTETELSNKGYATSSKLNAGFADTERKLAALNEEMYNKQPILVSGTNIKTINGESILGSGDIVISGGSSSDIYVLETITYESGVVSAEEFEKIRQCKILVLSMYLGMMTIVLQSKLNTEDELSFGTTMFYSSAVLYSITFNLNEDGSAGWSLTNTQQYFKTINGESILGESEGDITISGGGSSSGGSGAYVEVNHGTGDTTFTLTPNTFHIWEEVAALDLSLGDETSGIANEFLFQFTSGANGTTLTLPDGIVWANGNEISISANKTYEISITEGLGVWSEFNTL